MKSENKWVSKLHIFIEFATEIMTYTLKSNKSAQHESSVQNIFY